jgi:tRNA(Ile)-lysidine synthetase, N-terminal domain/tRNA(Ile)-lysidine synthetase, C-terminal domain
MVLLHALVKLREQSRPDLRLAAHHVHHGLMPQAEAWAEHVQRHCVAWSVACTIERVQVSSRRGRGLEAAARAARYRSYAQLSCNYLLLAHHAEDQAETVLLQLLRGGGPRAWAAMPAERKLGSLRLVRPLLGVRRSAIRAYAELHKLCWVDDASNQDETVSRNRLRLRVWPALEAAFPDAVERLAATARETQEMLDLSEQLAALDLSDCGQDDRLDRQALARLPELRRHNLLAYWLRQQGLQWPSRSALQEWTRQALEGPPEAVLAVLAAREGGAMVRQLVLSGAELRLEAIAPSAGTGLDLPSALTAPGRWLSCHGELRVEALSNQVANHRTLIDAPQQHGLSAWGLRRRLAGDRMRLSARSGHVPLKNIFQAHGIPARHRATWPLLTHADRVIAVVGLAVDAEYRRQPSWQLVWQPDNPKSFDSSSA